MAMQKKCGKYGSEGTSPNINKARPDRKKKIKTKETIESVRLHVENNARNVSCRCNRLVCPQKRSTVYVEIMMDQGFVFLCTLLSTAVVEGNPQYAATHLISLP